MGLEAFPKARRLRTRAEFLKVQGRGRKVTADPLLALSLPNGLSYARLGLTVSSKVGNAVVRNRIRRRLRECFRRRQDRVPPGLDLVLVARSSAAEASFQSLSNAFDQVIRKLSQNAKTGGGR